MDGLASRPHGGLPLGTREQFWQDLSEVADQCGNTEQPYVFLDNNASPGAPDGRHVFCDGLSSSSSTRLLRGFLEAHDLCLPSTSDIHEGSRTTWVSADGNNEHCIDFIAIPATLQERCTLSQAVPELDLGHGDWDHAATCLEMTWDETHISREPVSRARPSFDPHQISEDKVMQILCDYHPAPWQADVERHVQHVNDHVLQALHQYCPKRCNEPKKKFIDTATWELRRNKLKLKKRLQALRLRCRVEMKPNLSAFKHGDPVRHLHHLRGVLMQSLHGTMATACFVTACD